MKSNHEHAAGFLWYLQGYVPWICFLGYNCWQQILLWGLRREHSVQTSWKTKKICLFGNKMVKFLTYNNSCCSSTPPPTRSDSLHLLPVPQSEVWSQDCSNRPNFLVHGEIACMHVSAVAETHVTPVLTIIRCWNLNSCLLKFLLSPAACTPSLLPSSNSPGSFDHTFEQFWCTNCISTAKLLIFLFLFLFSDDTFSSLSHLQDAELQSCFAKGITPFFGACKDETL